VHRGAQYGNRALYLRDSGYRWFSSAKGYSDNTLGFRTVNGASRGGSFYTASHTAFMERCAYRLNNSKAQEGRMLGFRLGCEWCISWRCIYFNCCFMEL